MPLMRLVDMGRPLGGENLERGDPQVPDTVDRPAITTVRLDILGGGRPAPLQVLKQHGEIAPLVKEALAKPTLQQLFDDLLDAEGVTLEEVYAEQNQRPLQMLAEGLLEYEQGFAMWRFLHVQLVERIIGPLTSGTGGTLGSKYLQQTISQRFFPKLWEVRSKFFKG